MPSVAVSRIACTWAAWAEAAPSALWVEPQQVTVEDGIYTAKLGTVTPLADALFGEPDSPQIGRASCRERV